MKKKVQEKEINLNRKRMSPEDLIETQTRTNNVIKKKRKIKMKFTLKFIRGNK